MLSARWGQGAPTPVWNLRWQTLYAALLLLRAQLLIRFVPMARWRGSLGQVVEELPAGERAILPDDSALLGSARAHAQRVERAAVRFPREPSCLAKAMALQWLLTRDGFGARLVIAMQRGEKSAPHAFHAWVELGDAMLIGHCDRLRYRRVLCFAR